MPREPTSWLVLSPSVVCHRIIVTAALLYRAFRNRITAEQSGAPHLTKDIRASVSIDVASFSSYAQFNESSANTTPSGQLY